MDPPSSPAPGNFTNARRRTNTASSVAHSVEDLVMHRDPPPGFLAATASITSKAPTLGDIRSGTFGSDGWHRSGSGSGSSSRRRQSKGSRDKQGDGKVADHGERDALFAPLTEEPTRISTDIDERNERPHRHVEISEPSFAREPAERTDHDRKIPGISPDQRVHSSGYLPPPKLPWTESTWIALKAFWKWFTTPFGFLVTLYGLNVVAWGGMLFLLLCNASPVTCWSPVPTAENQKHMSDAAALSLGGPKYFNCNDINSPRRVWIEIDSQILNALFCVTGFGLVPWRFRDLYYLLRWRLASERRIGREKKMYGLRVLAGIHRGWFRLPGSETLDNLSPPEYLASLTKTEANTSLDTDLEANTLTDLPENDSRIPVPISKQPDDPMTSVRAPPTKLWKLDFFIWCQVWNTFFQCCLCGFMWGMDRYARPPWSTGLFVALACIIAGVGGLVSFLEGSKVKRVEGVAPSTPQPEQEDEGTVVDEANGLRMVNTGATGHESVHVAEKEKGRERFT